MRTDARSRKSDAMTGTYPDGHGYSAIHSPTGLEAIRKPPHFRHVIVSTLRADATLFVGFGSGGQAMWLVIATMVSLSALALLAAFEDK
jgi:hypothetical protein